MKKTLTLLFIFFLCATWSFAQDCTIGTTVGSSCTFATNGTLTIPAGDDLLVEVQAWGAGGGSNTGGGSGRARAGGGGGAYYTNTYTVAAGTVFSITVGQPVAGQNFGGSSIFDFGDGDVIVGGGYFGTNSGGAGGMVTGAIGAGTPTTGGTGGARNGNAGGGGGGGGAGPAGMNNNGDDGNATMGGDGGTAGGTDGGAPNNVGGLVTLPGGGAGGTGDGTNAGQNTGGVGEVIVTVIPLALPVELVRFNANAKDDCILLEWQTASELNNKGFEIQKSKDGIDWDMIEFVEGRGTVSGLNTYASTDKIPTLGANYYRLKQLDFDGKFDFSNIVIVDFNNRLNEVTLFPNPAKSQLTLINGEGQATIYNVLGQPVKQLTIDANQSTIQLADLLNGQYYIQVLQENGTIVTKQFSKVN